MTETIKRIRMCLPDFMSDSSGRMSCPPKNIAKGPFVWDVNEQLLYMNMNSLSKYFLSHDSMDGDLQIISLFFSFISMEVIFHI